MRGDRVKAKFIVTRDKGYDNIDAPREVLRTFKNEHDAVNFFEDPKNQRMNGVMYLEKLSSDGIHYSWDERHREWKENIA